jgi:hypothetical protein
MKIGLFASLVLHAQWQQLGGGGFHLVEGLEARELYDGEVSSRFSHPTCARTHRICLTSYEYESFSNQLVSLYLLFALQPTPAPMAPLTPAPTSASGDDAGTVEVSNK